MYCLRRAASRLLSTPATAPVRASWNLGLNNTRFDIPRNLPQPILLPSRWKSDDAKVQLETPSESNETSSRESATSTDSFEVDVSQIRDAAVDEGGEDVKASQRAFEESLHKNARTEKRTIFLKNGYDPKETIYIGNLFYDVTPEDVKEQLSKYGVVEEVNLIYDSRGISKGFGYVQFDSISSARRAISAMHLRIFEGRRVVAYFAQNNMRKSQVRSPTSKTLYVGNMAFEMTDRDINNLFKDVVNVIDVRVSVDRRTGQPRGFCHVEFIDAESAQTGLEILSRKAPYGRKLRVDYSNSNRTAFPVSS